jgi:hypothetical protein
MRCVLTVVVPKKEDLRLADREGVVVVWVTGPSILFGSEPALWQSANVLRVIDFRVFDRHNCTRCRLIVAVSLQDVCYDVIGWSVVFSVTNPFKTQSLEKVLGRVDRSMSTCVIVVFVISFGENQSHKVVISYSFWFFLDFAGRVVFLVFTVRILQ